MGPKTKNDCTGKGQLRTTAASYQSVTSRWKQESLDMVAPKGIPIVSQATVKQRVHENIMDWEDLGCAAVICTVRREVKVL
jgi:hypothetical protein